MKKLKIFAKTCAALTLCFSFSACSVNSDSQSSENISSSINQEESFTKNAETFSLNVPVIEGGWNTDATSMLNDYSIVIDNSDQSFTILVQSLPKSEGTLAAYPDIESVENADYQSTLAQFGIDGTEETIKIEGASKTAAYSYIIEQGEVTSKAFIAYIDMPEAYYIYTITGLEEIYNENIEAQKLAIESLKEINQENSNIESTTTSQTIE